MHQGTRENGCLVHFVHFVRCVHCARCARCVRCERRVQGFLCGSSNHAAEISAVCRKQRFSLRARNASCTHHDRDLEHAARGVEHRVLLYACVAGEKLTIDATGAIDEFVVGRRKIDHEIPIGLSKAHKHRRGDRVERDLRGRSSLEAR